MKIKILLIIGAFILCLVALVLIRQATGGPYRIHHVDFFDKGADWQDFRFSNMSPDKDGDMLTVDTIGQPGFFESPPQTTQYDFDEILLSWNCLTGDSGSIFISLAVSENLQDWYNFSYQKWGVLPVKFIEQEKQMPPKKIEGVGWVDVDYIKLEKAMKYYKFLVLCFADKSGLLSFDRASVCYSNTHARPKQYYSNQPKRYDIKEVSLAVPFKSQHSLPDSIEGLTCSPTSLTMVLNYYGRDYTPLEVAAETYDPNDDLYGNWPYNAQAAYVMGMKRSWISRHNSFAELVPELLAGKPLIINLAFENEKLSGAPYKQTDGHIIVVRGFDKNGNVLVNDPAGRDLSIGVTTYNIDQLTEVWTGHGGVVYHLWPE